MAEQLETILKRLDKLEAAVFSSAQAVPKKLMDFGGAAGGIKFLLKKGFFSKKRAAAEVKQELEQHGYHYAIAVVQTALNRASVKSGPLTSLKESGKKMYVARK